jgi:hypothetical protein
VGGHGPTWLATNDVYCRQNSSERPSNFWRSSAALRRGWYCDAAAQCWESQTPLHNAGNHRRRCTMLGATDVAAQCWKPQTSLHNAGSHRRRCTMLGATDAAAQCWEPQTLLQLHSKRRRTFKKTPNGRRLISVLY